MYNYKSNTFTNICTEKNSYTSLKNKNSKIFFCFFGKKHKNSADIWTAIWPMRPSLGLKMYNAIIIIETDSITKESKRKSQMRITTFEDKKKRSVKNGKNFNQPV